MIDADPRPLLIVNADDYGLTEGVSRGILHAWRDGIVTSTSILAVAPASASTGPWLRDAEGLGVGAHLAAVGEDPPILTAGEIPTLVDRRGAFASSWRQLLPRVAAGRVDMEDLRRELRAQMATIQGMGVPLTHVDTHQHIHLWPSIAQVVLDVAAEGGVRRVRIIRSASRGPIGRVVSRLADRFERRARAAGFAFPATASGLDEAGQLTAPVLISTLDRLARSGAPAVELAAHPGESDDPELERYRWGYHWAEELEALTAPEARAMVERLGFRLGTYADLPLP